MVPLLALLTQDKVSGEDCASEGLTRIPRARKLISLLDKENILADGQ